MSPVTQHSDIMFPSMTYWERHNIPSKAFLPKMHNLNQIMKKKKKPKTQSERQTTRQQKNTVQKCQAHEKQGRTEEAS